MIMSKQFAFSNPLLPRHHLGSIPLPCGPPHHHPPPSGSLPGHRTEPESPCPVTPAPSNTTSTPETMVASRLSVWAVLSLMSAISNSRHLTLRSSGLRSPRTLTIPTRWLTHWAKMARFPADTLSRSRLYKRRCSTCAMWPCAALGWYVCIAIL